MRRIQMIHMMRVLVVVVVVVVVVVTTATVATVTAMATAMLAAGCSQLDPILTLILILILGITIIDLLLLLLLGLLLMLLRMLRLVGAAPATGRGARRVLQQAAARLRLCVRPLLHHRRLGSSSDSSSLAALILAVGDRDHGRRRGRIMDGDRRLLHVLLVLLLLRSLRMRLCMRMLLVGVGRRLLVGSSSTSVAVAHNVVARGGGVRLGMCHRGMVMV